MAELSLKVVVALTILAFGVATKTDHELNVIKHDIAKREALLAANAIRKITIKTPQSKVQLATMASDCIVALQYTQYTLNNAIPSTVVEETVRKDLAHSAQLASTAIDELQQLIPGDPEKLKEKLAKVLELLHEAMKKNHEDVKSAPNRFAFNQVNKQHNSLIFGIYKLKYQATLFDTLNKDLGTEIKASSKAFNDVMSSLSSTDKTFEDESRQIAEHMTMIIAGIIGKLENWVELNSDKTTLVKDINQAVVASIQYYDNINRALGENRDAEYLKNVLVMVFLTGSESTKAAAQMDLSDSLGEQEFIRSNLFDVIAMGYAYTDIMKSVGTKV